MAAEVPETFQMTAEQYKSIISRAEFEIQGAKEELDEMQVENLHIQGQKENSSSSDEDLAKFHLEDYNKVEGEASDSFEEDKDFLGGLSNIDEAALGADDEYLKEADVEEEAAMDSEDLEDLRIRPSDNLVVACRTEDDLSYLEVYVYEEDQDNLYCHHDIMLPAFPLCVEWIGAPIAGSARGNFAAVGTFDPEIEIWNLDVLETPYPSIILGQKEKPTQPSSSPRHSRKKPKSPLPNEPSSLAHTDAVLSLSWNKLHSSMLLSGSADTTIKLWDINNSKALRSFSNHSDKVQTLQWNPSNATLLASAAYDKKAIVFDCRVPMETLSWSLLADPENLKWNPHNPHTFAVSDEEGRVLCFDTRSGSNSDPLFTLLAHAKPVTAIDWNPALSNCLLTVSADKSLKLWTLQDQITCVAVRDLALGKLFTGAFSVDSPNLVSTAGSKGVLSVINLFNDPSIVQAFSPS